MVESFCCKSSRATASSKEVQRKTQKKLQRRLKGCRHVANRPFRPFSGAHCKFEQIRKQLKIADGNLEERKRKLTGKR